MRKMLLLLASVSLAIPACELTPDAESSEHEREPIGEIAQRSVDCTTRQDTGYTQGKAFPITVVTVDGKPVELQTANAFFVMQQAAAKDDVNVGVVSGFRTMAEQQYLYNCSINKNCNNGNLAAKPGYSNHQSGHALDLNTKSSGVYDWLTAHGGQFGFKRTVPSEIWHWEWWGGGPGGGICAQAPKCDPHCKGAVMVAADCSEGNCGAYGASCADDDLGLRCIAPGCDPKGTKEFCSSDKIISTCKDGALSSGDCSQYASECVKDGAGAKCNSVICPSQAESSACLDGSKLLTCKNGQPGIGDCGAFGAACTEKLGPARCLPPWAAKLVKRASDADADETKAADYKVCAGTIVTTTFEVENQGYLEWTDTKGAVPADLGKGIRLGTRDGDKLDFKDPFTDTSRISVKGNANNRVVWDGPDCNNKPGCRRTIWEVTGAAPDQPGMYKTSWKVLDEGRHTLDTPILSATFRVYDCPDEIRDGVDPGAGGAGDAGASAGGGAAGTSGSSAGGGTSVGGSTGTPGSGGSAGTPDVVGAGGSSLAVGASGVAGRASGGAGAAGKKARTAPVGTTEEASGCSVAAPRRPLGGVWMLGLAASLAASRRRRGR